MSTNSDNNDTTSSAGPMGRLDKLFGFKLSPSARKFLGSLGWISVCFGIAKVLSSATTIVMARLLGKEIFGELALVLSAVGFFVICMMLGMPNSLIKFGSVKDDQSSETTFAIFATLVASVLFGATAWLARDWLSLRLDVPAGRIAMVVLLAAVMSMYTVFVGALQARHEYRTRGIVEIILSFLILPSFAVGYFVCGKSPESGVFAYLASYTVPVCIMAVMLVRRMRLGSLRNAPARPMLSYGIAACLGNTGFLLIMNYQLFQVQKILGEDQVGILKVYRGAGVENAVFLTAMFSTVFFPKASVTEDKAALWTTAVKAWAKFWPVAFAVYLILELAIVLLTGKKEYTLDPYLLVLMAVAATIISIQGSLGQIIAAHSVAGVRWGVLTSTSAGLINVLVTAFLVPRIGLPGAPIAMITSYSCLHLANIWLRHHLMGKSLSPNTAPLMPP